MAHSQSHFVRNVFDSVRIYSLSLTECEFVIVFICNIFSSFNVVWLSIRWLSPIWLSMKYPHSQCCSALSCARHLALRLLLYTIISRATYIFAYKILIRFCLYLKSVRIRLLTSAQVLLASFCPTKSVFFFRLSYKFYFFKRNTFKEFSFIISAKVNE